LLPSGAELDYITAKRQFSGEYSYIIKCRLQKKIERTAKEELSLLVEQGYLTEFCNVSSDLVREENEKIVSSDVNIMFESEAHTERGSPSLVGRGIANPEELPSCDSNVSVLRVTSKHRRKEMLGKQCAMHKNIIPYLKLEMLERLRVYLLPVSFLTY
jgi:hypothetical protein